MAEPETATELVLADPRPLTAGYAVSFAAALAVLGGISLTWLVFLAIALTQLVVGGSGLPALLVGATGILLFRAWRAMAEAIKRRLHPADVGDYAALPPDFGLLSAPLQSMIVHTRTTRAAVGDADLPAEAVSRELFDWLMTLHALSGDDAQYVEDRGWTVEALRADIVGISQSRTPHPQADRLLDRFEVSLLNRGADPFRR